MPIAPAQAGPSPRFEIEENRVLDVVRDGAEYRECRHRAKNPTARCRPALVPSVGSYGSRCVPEHIDRGTVRSWRRSHGRSASRIV